MQYYIGFLSLGTAETNNGCSRKLDSHLIASCQKSDNLLQVTIENVWDFFRTRYSITFAYKFGLKYEQSFVISCKHVAVNYTFKSLTH